MYVQAVGCDHSNNSSDSSDKAARKGATGKIGMKVSLG